MELKTVGIAEVTISKLTTTILKLIKHKMSLLLDYVVSFVFVQDVSISNFMNIGVCKCLVVTVLLFTDREKDAFIHFTLILS